MVHGRVSEERPVLAVQDEEDLRWQALADTKLLTISHTVLEGNEEEEKSSP